MKRIWQEHCMRFEYETRDYFITTKYNIREGFETETDYRLTTD